MKRIYLFLPLILAVASAANAETYHADDKAALHDIIMQGSNSTKLGLNNSDMAILNSDNWQTNETWVSKVEGVIWNTAIQNE